MGDGELETGMEGSLCIDGQSDGSDAPECSKVRVAVEIVNHAHESSPNSLRTAMLLGIESILQIINGAVYRDRICRELVNC